MRCGGLQSEVAVAVRCAPAGTPFASRPEAVEQVLGLYNRLGGDDPASTKVVWTNGLEWIVFTRDLLQACIGVLAERRGAQIAGTMDEGLLKRVVIPTDATPSGWLSAFVELADLIGA